MMLSNLKKKKSMKETSKYRLPSTQQVRKKASFTKLSKQKKPNAARGKALPWC